LGFGDWGYNFSFKKIKKIIEDNKGKNDK